jgi:hypothetical protein
MPERVVGIHLNPSLDIPCHKSIAEGAGQHFQLSKVRSAENSSLAVMLSLGHVLALEELCEPCQSTALKP